jgi:hypothetical protein
MPLVTALALVVAVLSLLVAKRASDFEKNIWNFEEQRNEGLSKRLDRDARLGMKMDMYASSARGHMASLRGLTRELMAKKDPKAIISSNRVFLEYHVHQALVGMFVVRYCARELFSPTRDDLSLAYQIENEYWNLSNREFNALSSMGIAIRETNDRAWDRALTHPELQGDHITIMPLPPTTLHSTLVDVLDSADDNLTGVHFFTPESTRVHYQFWRPDGQRITPNNLRGDGGYLGSTMIDYFPPE